MILLDGQRCDSLPLQDRGLAYGDGLFETVAVRDGQLLCWSAHMERLMRGCAALALPPPDSTQLRSEAQQLLGHQPRGVIKIIVTRGSGGRGYRPPLAPQARRIVAWHAWPSDPDLLASTPIDTWLCRTRLGFNPQLAGIKHLNRLEQVLASAEWPAPRFFEGLMQDFDGMLIEGTRSNLFVLRRGALTTPDLTRCGVAGIVRQAVITAATARGIAVRVEPLPLTVLEDAEEVFICNAVLGLRVLASLADGERIMPFGQTGLAEDLVRQLRAADVIP